MHDNNSILDFGFRDSLYRIPQVPRSIRGKMPRGRVVAAKYRRVGWQQRGEHLLNVDTQMAEGTSGRSSSTAVDDAVTVPIDRPKPRLKVDTSTTRPSLDKNRITDLRRWAS